MQYKLYTYSWRCLKTIRSTRRLQLLSIINNTDNIQDGRKIHSRTNIKWFYTTVWEKKMFCKHRISEARFPISAHWRLKQNCSKHLPSVPMQAVQEADFLDPFFFHHAWLGLFITFPFETSFQSCCKIWNCSTGSFLWSMQYGALSHFLLAFREFLSNVFPGNG